MHTLHLKWVYFFLWLHLLPLANLIEEFIVSIRKLLIDWFYRKSFIHITTRERNCISESPRHSFIGLKIQRLGWPCKVTYNLSVSDWRCINEGFFLAFIVCSFVFLGRKVRSIFFYFLFPKSATIRWFRYGMLRHCWWLSQVHDG